MNDQMRPPPYPPPYPPLPPTFAVARDEVTQPGLGETPREAALRVENVRLRRERNQARKERDAATLGTSAPGTSMVPEPTRAQKNTKLVLAMGKYATLLPLVILLARAAQKQWPEFAGVIDSVLQVLQ